MTELGKSVKKLYELRLNQDKLFSDINSLQDRLASVGPSDPHGTISDPLYEELKMRYKDAFVLAADELRATSDCLTKLQRAIQRQESKQRRSSSKKEEQSLPATRGKIVHFKGKKGDVWSHSGVVLDNGTEVAALVDEHSKPKLWILASVVGYRGGDRPRYEVQDEDPGDENNPTTFKKRYVLDMKKIICLPSLTDYPLSSRREFGKGDRVLALYPVGGATVLYPAIVLTPPKKRKDEYYLVEFDDDDGEQREVHARFVVPLLEEFSE